MKNYDAVIIGAGPTGICAALYLVRAGFNIAIIEKDAAGGQILSTAEVENYLGFPKSIKGWELADLFSAHLDDYPIDHIHGEVLSLETSDNLHTLSIADKDTITAKTVIIATGATNRPLGIKEEELYRGKGVSYCALCDGNFYKGMDIAVVGGGNSALEESLYLSRIVNKVYIIHRREGFRGNQIYLDKINKMPDKIELVTNHVVESLAGEPNLKSVRLRHVNTNEMKDIAVEGLFVYVGHLPNGTFFPKTLKLNEQGFIHTDVEMNTDIQGVFAAGDIRAKACRQISSAIGDGATAATAAISYLEHFNA